MDRTLRNIWLLNLSTFFFFLGISLTSPIISPFAITLGASPFIVGVVAGITSLVSLVSKPIGGFIGDYTRCSSISARWVVKSPSGYVADIEGYGAVFPCSRSSQEWHL